MMQRIRPSAVRSAPGGTRSIKVMDSMGCAALPASDNCPRASNVLARREPKKPAPPVITIFMAACLIVLWFKLLITRLAPAFCCQRERSLSRRSCAAASCSRSVHQLSENSSGRSVATTCFLCCPVVREDHAAPWGCRLLRFPFRFQEISGHHKNDSVQHVCASQKAWESRPAQW